MPTGVTRRVGCAAQLGLGGLVPDDEDGRFAAHPLGFPVDVLIGNEIAQDDDACLAEGANVVGGRHGATP